MQLSLLTPPPPQARTPRKRRAYVIQGQEVPEHLPRLQESAETMQARVLELFRSYTMPTLPVSHWALTPSMCAQAMGLELTMVRPRITQLSKRTEGPRLERCRWIKRAPTKGGGSEGWYRYVSGGEK